MLIFNLTFNNVGNNTIQDALLLEGVKNIKVMERLPECRS